MLRSTFLIAAFLFIAGASAQIVLQDGVKVDGSVAQFAIQNYTFAVSGDAKVVKLTVQQRTGTVFVFGALGRSPSFDSYDFKDISDRSTKMWQMATKGKVRLR